MNSPLKAASEIARETELDSIDWCAEPRSDREAILRMRALLSVVDSWRANRSASLGDLGVDLRDYLGITAADEFGRPWRPSMGDVHRGPLGERRKVRLGRSR